MPLLRCCVVLRVVLVGLDELKIEIRCSPNRTVASKAHPDRGLLHMLYMCLDYVEQRYIFNIRQMKTYVFKLII